jgi:hypothetical protein
MGGGFREPKAPTPVGSGGAGERKVFAFFRRDITWSALPGKVCAARIYFDTNRSDLRSDGVGALFQLVKSLRDFLLLDEGIAEVTCWGWADIRGTEKYNDGLSRRRAMRVRGSLDGSKLASVLGCTIKKDVLAFGSKFAPEDGALWADSRRVDVIVQVTTRKDLDTKNNPFILRRLEMFKKFFPGYRLWKDRGLEYLLDQYEMRIGRGDAWVKIKPTDSDKVLDLTLQLADDEAERNTIKNTVGDSKSANWRDKIASEYEVEYHRAWDRAFASYEKAYEQFQRTHPGMPSEAVRENVLTMTPISGG